MATRAEVLSHITGKYKTESLGVLESGMAMIKMVWKFENGRSHLVWIGASDVHLVVMSPFARAEEITADKALTQPTDFGVALAFGSYCLTDVVPLENVDANEIEIALELMPVLADEIEEKFGLGDTL
jgi:hypothetical protein